MAGGGAVPAVAGATAVTGCSSPAAARVADSETVSELAAPDEATTVRFRPRRARVVCWLAAVSLLVVFTAVSFGLRGPTGAGVAVFQAGDQAAMIGLGVLGALGILMFTRPRVIADRNGIRVRNLVGAYELPWAVVREVRFNRGAPWATLELQDDDLVSMMAVQAADKEYAVRAVRALRGLLAASRVGDGAPAEDG